MAAGSLGAVARAALVGGAAALGGFSLTVLRPVRPMLADAAEDVGEALARLGPAVLEWKIDGARIQAHKAGETVRIFSRHLRDVTAALPEVVEIVRALPARELVLDGEAIALDPHGWPLPFQTTMRRFGRRLEVDRLREALPLTPFFFDCLLVDGTSLVDEPQARRLDALLSVAGERVVPHLVEPDPAAAAAFFDEALRRGHEGVMAKARGSAYAAGSRGAAWLKVKRARSLDLVVLAAEWGHGRRRGWLSNLHLGARDPASNGFVMLGKTFKGLTDAMLAWQTERLLALEIARDAHAVHVRPELVVEIAFNDIQESPQYPGGLALRFARVKRFRPDKPAAEADTIDTVRRIHEKQV
jgi:DNA ligase-1